MTDMMLNSYLTIDQILADENNVRRDDTTDIDSLLESIVVNGIVTALTVTPENRLVGGHRRRAAVLKGIEIGVLPSDYPIPVFYIEPNEDAGTQLMLVENMQRVDLDPIEQGKAFARMTDAYGLNAKQIAERIGKSQSLVRNRVKLLELPENIQGMVARGDVGLDVAGLFTEISDFPDEIIQMVNLKMPVERVQNRVDQLKGQRKLLEVARWVEAQGAIVYTSHMDMIKAGYQPDYSLAISNPKKADIDEKVDEGEHVLIQHRAGELVVQFGRAPEPTQASDKESHDDEVKAARDIKKQRQAAIGDAIRTSSPGKATADGFVEAILPRILGSIVSKLACRFLGVVDNDIMAKQGVLDKTQIRWTDALSDFMTGSARNATLAKTAIVAAIVESSDGWRSYSSYNQIHIDLMAALDIELDEHGAVVRIEE